MQILQQFFVSELVPKRNVFPSRWDGESLSAPHLQMGKVEGWRRYMNVTYTSQQLSGQMPCIFKFKDEEKTKQDCRWHFLFVNKTFFSTAARSHRAMCRDWQPGSRASLHVFGSNFQPWLSKSHDVRTSLSYLMQMYTWTQMQLIFHSHIDKTGNLIDVKKKAFPLLCHCL